MHAAKIQKFMELGGQELPNAFETGNEERRKLGAQLLLSEVLEYVIHGLGITPVVGNTEITDPNNLEYRSSGSPPDKKEMLDGLADVAYTMYWNACAFGIPLEEGFELVCDNNLEKFVKLDGAPTTVGALEPHDWHCGKDVSWPAEVQRVEVICIQTEYYAVGKDQHGKVRKPSHFQSVDLSVFLS